MNYTVRTMNAQDIPAVARLERECFSTPWDEKALEESLSMDCARFFVAVSQDEIIGYIGAYNICGEVSVNDVAVADKYRRSGVACALIERLCEYVQGEGAEFITLEVRVSNEAAILLYRKCGFTQSGLRADFYREPTEDAILMRKAFG